MTCKGKKVNCAHDLLIHSLDLLKCAHNLLFRSLNLLNHATYYLIPSIYKFIPSIYKSCAQIVHLVNSFGYNLLPLWVEGELPQAPYLLLYSTEESKSYRFKTTNNERVSK